MNTKLMYLFTLFTLTGLLLMNRSAQLAQATFQANSLPPRPTQPTAVPVSGATIILRADNTPVNAWTIVQWQDAQGDWHDVEGWRGYLDKNPGNEKIWWVAPQDFDTGPFRWQLYEQPDGDLLANSDSFNLPAHSGAITFIEVALAPWDSN